MNPDSSPFTPGQPVDVESFTGRQDQVEELLTMVRLARKKKLQVGWISGERGIGKSSLAAFIGSLAERNEKAIVAHVHLGGVGNLGDLVSEAHVQLLKDNENKSWGKALWKSFGERIERVGMWGVDITLKATSDDLDATAGNFSDALGSIVHKAGEDREVLLLILDDINGLADKPVFAHWIKSMVDSEATSRKTNPVCLIFVGLEERFRKMLENNPSVGRVFRPIIDMKPWDSGESEDFFKHAFAKHDVVIGDREIQSLARYSGGLPAVAHEIGNAVWRITKDGQVNQEVALTGVLIAANRIGEHFLESEVIQALQSKKYRSILRKIAMWLGPFEIEFSKEQLRSLKLTADEEKNMNNFLNRMRKLGAIVPAPEGERGVYHFATYMHRIYFSIEAARTSTAKQRQSQPANR